MSPERQQRALDVVAVARRLVKKPMYHDCRGPSCLLCVALTEVIADFDAARDALEAAP